ncbi:hypothetical protein L327_0121215 [Yersinia pestis S3]|nr:hypothetical protein L327_0121215 [Yersinia pestis S3]
MNRLPTLYGIIAILLWSMSVALTRGLAEALGPFGAGSAIYSVSGILVWLVAGKLEYVGSIPLICMAAVYCLWCIWWPSLWQSVWLMIASKHWR